MQEDALPLAAQWAVRFMTETKVLPASVLKRKVNEKVNRRKHGKKELRDLKDEPKLDLLPTVFASGDIRAQGGET